jgi:hypothetical protein
MTGSATRAWTAVVGSVLAFALLIETAGLFPAVIVTVLVASMGTPTITRREAVICAVSLALGVAVLFVAILEQPFLLVRGW